MSDTSSDFERKEKRRQFLKKGLATTAYVAQAILTFSTKDVAKASPGGGFGQNNQGDDNSQGNQDQQ